jgi:hypothetical protein
VLRLHQPDRGVGVWRPCHRRRRSLRAANPAPLDAPPTVLQRTADPIRRLPVLRYVTSPAFGRVCPR